MHNKTHRPAWGIVIFQLAWQGKMGALRCLLVVQSVHVQVHVGFGSHVFLLRSISSCSILSSAPWIANRPSPTKGKRKCHCCQSLCHSSSAPTWIRTICIFLSLHVSVSLMHGSHNVIHEPSVTYWDTYENQLPTDLPRYHYCTLYMTNTNKYLSENTWGCTNSTSFSGVIQVLLCIR